MHIYMQMYAYAYAYIYMHMHIYRQGILQGVCEVARFKYM
jgi:hypothetical protein